SSSGPSAPSIPSGAKRTRQDATYAVFQ
ncbi:hypothetical protein BpHYR1_009242, partial [Brachionus plicatilis]